MAGRGTIGGSFQKNREHRTFNDGRTKHRANGTFGEDVLSGHSVSHGWSYEFPLKIGGYQFGDFQVHYNGAGISIQADVGHKDIGVKAVNKNLSEFIQNIHPDIGGSLDEFLKSKGYDLAKIKVKEYSFESPGATVALSLGESLGGQVGGQVGAVKTVLEIEGYGIATLKLIAGTQYGESIKPAQTKKGKPGVKINKVVSMGAWELSFAPTQSVDFPTQANAILGNKNISSIGKAGVASPWEEQAALQMKDFFAYGDLQAPEARQLFDLTAKVALERWYERGMGTMLDAADQSEGWIQEAAGGEQNNYFPGQNNDFWAQSATSYDYHTGSFGYDHNWQEQSIQRGATSAVFFPSLIAQSEPTTALNLKVPPVDFSEEVTSSRFYMTPNIDKPSLPQSSSVIGQLSPEIKAIPGGIHIGVISTNNALGANVSVGIQLQGIDAYVTKIINNMPGGHKVGKSQTLVIHGETYKYWVESVGGPKHVGEYRLTLEHIEDGVKISKHLRHPEKQSRIIEALNQALGVALEPIIQRDKAAFEDQCNQALQEHHYLEAHQVREAFFNKYKDLPALAQYADETRNSIVNHEVVYYLEQAKDFLEQGNPAEAIATYQKIQDLDPDNLQAADSLATIYVAQQDLPKAITEIEKVAAHVPKYADYLQTLKVHHQANTLVLEGQELLKAGQEQAAIAKLQEAQGVLPDHATAAIELAKIYAVNSDYGRAIAEVKKVPGQEAYIAELQAFKIIGNVDPFMRALSNIANQHLQYRLHPVVAGGLRLFTAVHHIHPQAWLAVLHLMAAGWQNNTHAYNAWKQVLTQQYPSGIFLANGLLGAAEALGIDHYIPYHREVTTWAGHAQYGVMGHQLIRDLNVFGAASLAELNWRAIRSPGVACIIQMLFTPVMLRAYDRRYHAQLVPETPRECVTREMISTLTGVASSFVMPWPLVPVNVVANLAVPVVKGLTGLYPKEAARGRLINARQLVANQEWEEAFRRYQSLPDYQVEYSFAERISKLEAAGAVNFSCTDKPHTVNVGVAVHLVAQAIQLKAFKQLPISIQNNYVHVLKNITEIFRSESIPEASGGVYQGYAVTLYNALHFNSASQQFSHAAKATHEQALGQRSTLQKVSDWFKQTAEIRNESLTLAEKLVQESQQLAVKLSSGDKQTGFGAYLEQLSQARQKQNIRISELHYEWMMVEVLDYFYADGVVQEQQKEHIDFQRVLAYLIVIQTQSTDVQLKRLAAFVQQQFTESSESTNIMSTKMKREVAAIHADVELSKLVAEANKMQFKDASDQHSQAELIDHLQYFFALVKSNSTVNEALLAELLQEFTEPLPTQDANSMRQFRYRKDFQENADHSLVKMYLSAMVAFMYVFNTLVYDNPPHPDIIRFQNEILDNVLLRGYLPPFTMMLVPRAWRSEITQEQMQVLLAWYGINLYSNTAQQKLTIVVALHKSQYFSGKNGLRSLAHLCSTCGNFVRALRSRQEQDAANERLKQLIVSSSQEQEIVGKVIKELKAGANPDADIMLPISFILLFHGKLEDNVLSLLQIAIQREWPTVVKLLCQYGAKVHGDHFSPVQFATILYFEQASEHLLAIICTLAKYGAKLNQMIGISVLQNARWWLRYKGKKTIELLPPAAQERVLAALRSSLHPAFDRPSSYPVVTKNLTQQNGTENRDFLRKVMSVATAPYTLFEISYLLKHYLRENNAQSTQVLPVTSLVNYLDYAKSHLEECLTHMVLAEWLGAWTLLCLPHQLNQPITLIYSGEQQLPLKYLHNQLGEDLIVHQPKTALELHEKGIWLIEMCRALVMAEPGSSGLTDALLSIRWQIHQPILNDVEKTIAIEKQNPAIQALSTLAPGDVNSEALSTLGKIHIAAREGDIKKLRDYLQQHPEYLHLRSAGDQQPVHFAAANHQPKALQYLINAGANMHHEVSTVDSQKQVLCSKRQALHLAILGIDLEQWRQSTEYCLRVIDSLRVLVLNGADLYIPDSSGSTAYDIALWREPKIAEILKTFQQDRVEKRQRLFELAHHKELTASDQRWLQACDGIVGLFDPPLEQEQAHLVLQAVAHGSVEFFLYLLKQRPDFLHVQSPETHYSILHVAAKYCRVSHVAIIVSQFPELLHAQDESSETPLCTLIRELATLSDASLYADIQQVIQLICFNPLADLTISNKAQQTPIQVAESLNAPILQPLIQRMKIMSNNAQYLLTNASKIDADLTAVEHALAQGAYISQKSVDDGYMVVHKVAYVGNADFMRYLLKHHPTILIATTSDGLMPLHCACKNNQEEMVDYLLFIAQNMGFSGLYNTALLATDKHGFSALDYAWQQGHSELYRRLLFHYARILPEESLLMRLKKHLVGAINLKQVGIVSGLILMAGLESININHFAVEFVAKLDIAQQRGICEVILAATLKGVVSKVQLEALKKSSEQLALLLGEELHAPAAEHLPNIEMIDWQQLLTQKRNVYYRDTEGNLPVHHLARLGHLLLLQDLVFQDYQLLKMKGNSNWLPIHFAAANHQSKVLQFLLIQTPGLVNARVDEAGQFNSPLLLAVIHFCDYQQSEISEKKLAQLRETINILIAYGADPEMPNLQGKTARELLKDQHLPLDLIPEGTAEKAKVQKTVPQKRTAAYTEDSADVQRQNKFNPATVAHNATPLFSIFRDAASQDNGWARGRIPRERIHDAGGGGNCFFLAVAYELRERGLGKYSHTELRQQSVQYLIDHPAMLHAVGDALPEQDQGDPQRYLARMSRQNEYVEGAIIEALALKYDIALRVHNGIMHIVGAEPINGGLGRPEIALLYDVRAQHYQVVLPPERVRQHAFNM